MIPYFELPEVSFGRLRINVFGPLVALAIVSGLSLVSRRCARLRLDTEIGAALGWYAVICGFIGAHLFSILLYFPHRVAENPVVLLKLWEDISVFGAILGGVAGVWLFFQRRPVELNSLTRWAYLDVLAFVFPAALAVGRIGCSFVHDHPGPITTFPIAVSLATAPAQEFIAEVYRAIGRADELPDPTLLSSLGFHDLGWYELLYVGGVLTPVFQVMDRVPRRPGFYTAAFIVMYMPVRFLLDSFRLTGLRYGSLTPAQWIALASLGGLAVLPRRLPPRAITSDQSGER